MTGAHWWRPTSSAFVLALAASSCSPDPNIEVRDGTAIEHGAALFQDPSVAKTSLNAYTCATCHDIDDPGPSPAVTRTGAPVAGVTRRASFWGGQEIDLLRSINHCLYYFMLTNKPWTAEDVEARAMYAYLDSISSSGEGEEAVSFTVIGDIVDLPAGDPGSGGVIYDRACAYCHGAAHTGDGRLVERASILPEQTLSEHPLDKYTPIERRLVFIEKVRHGTFLGYGGQMPPFSEEKLSDDEMAALLAFLGLYGG